MSATTTLDAAQRAVMLAAQGRHHEAEHAWREAIAATPEDPRHHLGLAECLVRQGRGHEALAGLRDAPQSIRSQAELACLQAAIHFLLGEWVHAKAVASEVVALHPEHEKASLLLVSCCLELRQPDEAARIAQQTVEYAPHSPEALTLLGICHAAQGDLATAINVLQSAAARFNYPPACLELARMLRKSGKASAAEDVLVTLCTRHPPTVPALHEWGLCCLDLGRADQAVIHLEQALAMSPTSAALENDLGQAHARAGNAVAARKHLERALQLRPDMGLAAANLGLLLAHAGEIDDSRRMLERAYGLQPLPGTRVTHDLLLPPIVNSHSHIQRLRGEYAQAIQRLADAGITLADPAREVFLSNFFLAYHGLDNKKLQQDLANFFLSACPALAGTPGAAERALHRRQRDGKLRIGFFSLNIHLHSVALCFAELINLLSHREGFDVVLISTRDASDPAVRGLYANYAGTMLKVAEDLALARQAIESQSLDVLVYLDIGMDTLSYFLAYARIAPVQVVMGGHPDTTGIANIDYFVSCMLAEAPDAASNYSERLALLPVSAMQLRPTPLPVNLATTKAAMGFDPSAHLYVCPMKLQKIHPDFDIALAAMLDLDPKSEILLFEDNSHPARTQALQARLNQAIPARLRTRLRFLPWQYDPVAFARIIQVSDVVLDPFHFGIGSTAATVFAVNTPLVTWPAPFLRGRTGLYFSRVLGLPEMIAETHNDYVARAVQLASDREANLDLRQKIGERSPLLFQETESVRHFGDWLEHVANH